MVRPLRLLILGFTRRLWRLSHHLWALGVKPAVQQTSKDTVGLEKVRHRSRPPAGPLGSSRRAGLVRLSVLYSQWLFQKNRSSTRPLMKTISSTKGGSASPGSCGRNRQLPRVSCCHQSQQPGSTGWSQSPAPFCNSSIHHSPDTSV